jgi:hypothetical protein
MSTANEKRNRINLDGVIYNYISRITPGMVPVIAFNSLPKALQELSIHS